MSPSALTHPFKPLNSIEASQLIQTDLDCLVVRLIRRDDFSDCDARHLTDELKARLGQNMRIDIEFVNSLPREANGKFKWVICKVAPGK